MKREYKDNITIDEVKSGEVIRTEIGTYYLVIKLPRHRPAYIEVDISKRRYEIKGEIETVFAYNGQARILPTEKEI